MHAIHARTSAAFLADAAARCATPRPVATRDLAGAAAALAAVEAQLIAGGIVPAPRQSDPAEFDALLRAIESGIADAIARGC